MKPIEQAIYLSLASIIVLLCVRVADGLRSLDEPQEQSFTELNFKGAVDAVDWTPLFDNQNNTYNFQGQTFKCCCNVEGECAFGMMDVPNSCTPTQSWWAIRDVNGCGCLVGFGRRSYEKFGRRECLVTIEQAIMTFAYPKSWQQVNSKMIIESRKDVHDFRLVGNWNITYGECNTKCGSGVQQQIASICVGSECPMLKAEENLSHIPCLDVTGCEWSCEHWGQCGWGDVGCSGAEEHYCHLKSELQSTFKTKLDYKLRHCFKKCPREESLKSMCAVTANHLDEQYGSVQHLIDQTCFSNIEPENKADIVVLMTQELNHANLVGAGKNDFYKYVGEDSLIGYRRAAVCAPDMSANTAVFIKNGMGNHIFPSAMECSNTDLRSTCDWTNCKGSSVMHVPTSSGRLIVGNWHGARAGTFSLKRIMEFEDTINAIFDIPHFNGRKFVVFGGDVNVRSQFIESQKLNLSNVLSPEEIWEEITDGDILGEHDWTVDQHLSGEVGIDDMVKSRLKRFPLKQAKGWNKICPTYRKYNSSMQVVNTKSLLKCRSAEGKPVEYLDMDTPDGEKSRAPSWTERIFLSRSLFEACEPVQKDIRNLQSDHDPMFVQCRLP